LRVIVTRAHSRLKSCAVWTWGSRSAAIAVKTAADSSCGSWLCTTSGRVARSRSRSTWWTLGSHCSRACHSALRAPVASACSSGMPGSRSHVTPGTVPSLPANSVTSCPRAASPPASMPA
jgi:hypothetical protein